MEKDLQLLLDGSKEISTEIDLNQEVVKRNAIRDADKEKLSN